MLNSIKNLFNMPLNATKKVAGVLKPDPRINDKNKIDAPGPLPHVSRKALTRIPYCLEKPTSCHYCNGTVTIKNNSAVYKNPIGDWPYIYICSDCSAYVGLHPHTDIPLGTLADKSTRQARSENKKHFLLLSNLNRDKTRTEMYQWLADEMQLPIHECHWAHFNKEQAERAGLFCQMALKMLP